MTKAEVVEHIRQNVTSKGVELQKILKGIKAYCIHHSECIIFFIPTAKVSKGRIYVDFFIGSFVKEFELICPDKLKKIFLIGESTLSMGSNYRYRMAADEISFDGLDDVIDKIYIMAKNMPHDINSYAYALESGIVKYDDICLPVMTQIEDCKTKYELFFSWLRARRL